MIIATFTFVQANYTVHADISGGDTPVRDSARFHFGFTPPLKSYAGPERVIAAVARSQGRSRPDPRGGSCLRRRMVAGA